MDDYAAYRDSVADAIGRKDELRSVTTVRLTRLLLNQNLALSLVALYSPSDKDVHIRPKAHYAISDHLAVEAGAVLSYGTEDYTFYGQFEKNNSVYSSLRYSF